MELTAAADGRVQTVGVCLAYLIVVVFTNRGLIAAPSYRIVDRSVRDCRARTRVLLEYNTESRAAKAAADAINAELTRLETRGEIAWWLPGLNFGIVSIPLTKLAAGWRAFHAAERRLVDIVTEDALQAYADTILLELEEVDPSQSEVLAKKISAAEDSANKRTLIEHAHFLVHVHYQNLREIEFEKQRIALWLATVGLFGVILIAFAFDHRSILLMGALGGFLAPVAGTLVERQPASWGVMVLSPVGGALSAVGGLLLIRLLSDPNINVLGEVFRNNSWGAPTSALALAAALLFGFSGRLFSRVAISASAQLTPSRDSRDDDQK